MNNQLKRIKALKKIMDEVSEQLNGTETEPSMNKQIELIKVMRQAVEDQTDIVIQRDPELQPGSEELHEQIIAECKKSDKVMVAFTDLFFELIECKSSQDMIQDKFDSMGEAYSIQTNPYRHFGVSKSNLMGVE